MKKNKYLLIKDKKYIKYHNIDVKDSFDLKKKKEGTIKFYDDKMVDNIINKTIENHFKKLLDFVLECEEDNDPDGLLLALNETEKFKREMINKYEKHLDKKKMEFNKKKIEVIEKELKNKLIMYRLINTKNVVNSNYYVNDDYEEEMEEERHRTR